MNNPGLKDLGAADLAKINAGSTAGGYVITSGIDQTGATVQYLDRLDGMLSATIQATFTYGSGGTSVAAIVETSASLGASWTEVARFGFTTSSASKVVNLSALTPVTTVYSSATALADDAVKDGIFGSWWRVRLITVGTYGGNSALSVRLAAR